MKRTALALSTLALACALAACQGEDTTTSLPSSGSGGSHSATATPQASQDPDDALMSYVRCMRENGVDMPDPSADGGLEMTDPSVDPAALERANGACGHLLGESMDMNSGALDSAQMDAALALAGCMRDKGHDFPDPSSANGGLQLNVPEDPAEAESWSADLQVCASAGAGK